MKKTAPLIALGVLGLAVPVALWALQEHGPEQLDYARLFWVVAVMLVAGKFSGELSERLGQPAVLGELIAGALLGGSLLGVIPTGAADSLTPIIRILAEIGVVILLFEIGLETDLKAMFRVGRGAASIACVGVVLPMIGGILFWLSPLGLHQYGPGGVTMTAIFIGGTLTATSVGITARVLQDLRVMHSSLASSSVRRSSMTCWAWSYSASCRDWQRATRCHSWVSLGLSGSRSDSWWWRWGSGYGWLPRSSTLLIACVCVACCWLPLSPSCSSSLPWRTGRARR
jgi:hypothetical protein